MKFTTLKVCLLIVALILPLTSSTRAPTINLADNSPVPFALKRAGSIMTIGVSYQDIEGVSFDAKFNISTPATGTPFALGLSSSRTYIADNCKLFNSFAYTKNQFSRGKDLVNLTNINSIFFYDRAYEYDNISMVLDERYWSLQDQALLSSNCYNALYTTRAEAYGMIGLSFSSRSKANFASPTVFSVFINKTLQDGELYFGVNEHRAQSADPEASLDATDDWYILNAGTINVGSTAINHAGNVLLDTNLDAIGLPDDIYTSVFTALTALDGITCGNGSVHDEHKSIKKDPAFPNCSYKADLSTLPNITINVGGETINLPYTAYTGNSSVNNSITSFNLLLRPLSGVHYGPNYVTSSYEGVIILGINVMSHYYTVFDGRGRDGNKILLYISNESPLPIPDNSPDQPDSGHFPWAVVIVLIIVVLIGIGFIVYKCIQKKRALLVADDSPQSFYQPAESGYLANTY